MSIKTISTLLVSSLFFLVGCEQRIGYLNAISTKNIFAKNVDLEKLPQTKNVEAEKSAFLGIGVTLQDAVDQALEKGNGNLMIDTVVYAEDYVFFWGLKVRGTVVNVPNAGAPTMKK